jgi:hypothetical protein
LHRARAPITADGDPSRDAPLFLMSLAPAWHLAEGLVPGKMAAEAAPEEDATATTALDAMVAVRGAELCVVPVSSSVPAGA